MNVEDIAVVFADAHADGFVREDRRRVIGLPTADRVEFLEQVRAWTHMDDGKPSFDVTEVAEVAGDRLVLCGVSISYESGSCSEMLQVILFDHAVDRIERHVSFDSDDLDGARAELVRLHHELQSRSP